MADDKKDQKKKAQEDVEVGFNLGTISFGSLFQGFGNLMDLVNKMEESGKDEVNTEREFTSPSGRVNAVYGLSVRTNLTGKPTVETFGNVKKTSRGTVVEEERQPLVDIFDEKDHVLVIAELPGVEEQFIKVKVEGDILTLSATQGDRKYYKEVVLPDGINAGEFTHKYKNGILEIRVSKK